MSSKKKRNINKIDNKEKNRTTEIDDDMQECDKLLEELDKMENSTVKSDISSKVKNLIKDDKEAIRRMKEEEHKLSENSEDLDYLDDDKDYLEDEVELDDSKKTIEADQKDAEVDKKNDNENLSSKEDEANLDFFEKLNREDNIKSDRIRKQKPKRLASVEGDDKVTDRIKEVFRSNTKNFIAGTAIAFLFVALVIALIVDSGNKKEEKKETVDGSFIEIDETPMIDIMNNYYAALSNGETEVVRKILEDDSEITDEEIADKCSEAKAYTDLVGSSFLITDCYVQQGLNKNEYIAYMKFQIQIKSIDTPTTGIFTCYLVDESANNKTDYRISSKVNDKSTDVYKYVLKMSNCKNVTDLFEKVDEELESACAKDENLSQIVDALENNGETTTADEETTKPMETTKPAEMTSK